VGDRIVWRRRVGVGLLALLLLVKDNVLPSSFGALSDCLPSHDGFLFLSEPLYFLLDPDQFLLLFCSFDFPSFLIPVLHLD
jgi:hypothetical protein